MFDLITTGFKEQNSDSLNEDEKRHKSAQTETFIPFQGE